MIHLRLTLRVEKLKYTSNMVATKPVNEGRTDRVGWKRGSGTVAPDKYHEKRKRMRKHQNIINGNSHILMN